MAILANNQSNGPSIFSDLQSLNGIRKQATVDSRGAIKAAAKEFEAFFMNMMLKSMRQASEVMGKDSLFGSEQEKMFIGMLDEQMSVELSQKGNLGIADLMVRNLLGNKGSEAKANPPGQINRTLRSMAYHRNIEVDNKNISPVNNKDNQTITIIAEKILTENQKLEPAKPKIEAVDESSEIIKAEKKSLFDNAADFINQLLPHARKIADKIGLDPKLLIAQAALETGWGQYIMHDSHGRPSHNLFGIKSNSKWQGPSVKIDTLEVEKGEFVKTKSEFRVYENFEKSFADYIDFLQNNPRYKAALKVVDNATQFIQSLQSAGYATDPNYANKILRIFNSDMNPVKSGNPE